MKKEIDKKELLGRPPETAEEVEEYLELINGTESAQVIKYLMILLARFELRLLRIENALEAALEKEEK